MNQNHMKLTDQEWSDLIRDCRSSSMMSGTSVASMI